ncbi:hypothetical protein JHK82_050912 [Glycine max]|nr:hypothetical protein JHK86_050768 [Glycine max]KAG4936690.1 hypothetical protein JHK85_051609 [Glycine max]KAG5092134.1 hypothetical protein JHK82_050912 [Glycine max]
MKILITLKDAAEGHARNKDVTMVDRHGRRQSGLGLTDGTMIRFMGDDYNTEASFSDKPNFTNCGESGWSMILTHLKGSTCIYPSVTIGPFLWLHQMQDRHVALSSKEDVEAIWSCLAHPTTSTEGSHI